MSRHPLFLDTYNRITQTTFKEWWKDDEWKKDVVYGFSGYIKDIEEKIIVLEHKIEENKYLFLPHETRFDKSYKRKVREKLEGIKFDKGSFLTLTTDPKHFLNVIEATKHLKKQWNQQRSALKRKHGNFDYLCVLEFTKSGIPHLHVLLNDVFFTEEDLSKDGIIHRNWENQGIQIKVGKIRNNHIMEYVMKYVRKSLVVDYKVYDPSLVDELLPSALYWITNCRLFSTSRGLINTSLDIPELLRWLFDFSMWQFYAVIIKDEIEKILRGSWDTAPLALNLFYLTTSNQGTSLKNRENLLPNNHDQNDHLHPKILRDLM